MCDPNFNCDNLTADDVVAIIPKNPVLAAQICACCYRAKVTGEKQRFTWGFSIVSIDYIPGLLSRPEVKEINHQYVRRLWDEGITLGLGWEDE